MWAIYLDGPRGFSLIGNTKNPAAVYSQLIKTIRKFVEQVNPEALTFTAYDSSQAVIYESFYKRYLKKQFTRVQSSVFINNDVLQSWNLSPDVWQDIQMLDKAVGERVSQEKERRTNLRQQKALRGSHNAATGIMDKVKDYWRRY